MKKRTFLSPAAVSLAALLTAAGADATQISRSADKSPAIMKMAESPAKISQFVIERSVGPDVRLAQHMSHSSHASHRSHSSHVSSRF